MLTPLKVQMLLHYYAIAEPYAKNDPTHANSIAVNQQRQWLVNNDLIIYDVDSSSNYRITERGIVLINAICALPLPIEAWKMP